MDMNPRRTVLLLNASNLKTSLMYPYAFVQVSEIAARHGIRTVRHDLYGILEDHWNTYLRKLLQKDSFDMILITLRNTDAVDVNDYIVGSPNNYYHQENKSPLYYPIQATKRLIQVLRKLTKLPIVIGGFAFSIFPEKLMNYLKPDYGVIGGPDAFFEHFEDVLNNQRLNQVANLIYFQANTLQKGSSQFFLPAYRQEWTDEIIKERDAFNSRFSGETIDLTVPIEVSRGCPKSCLICSEPLVKGKKVRYRDLDVIEDEINFLRKYQLNELFFICSEINAGSNEFVKTLSDRMIEINEEREDHEKVSWYGLHLLTLSADELKHIRKAGYLGTFNPLPNVSLDDHNLVANKVPLKSDHIINYFTQAKKVVKEEYRHTGKKFYPLEERIFRAFQPMNSSDFVKSWNIFLGNVDATPETIRVTLKRVDDAGLAQIFDSCYVNKATRIYDFMQLPEEMLQHAWSSVNGVIKNTYNELYPSFTYPPALLHHFGSAEILDEFFVLVGDTYLSQKHLLKKDWNRFLASNLDPNTFFSWWTSAIKSNLTFDSFTAIPEVLKFLNFLRNHSIIDNIKLLFNPTPDKKCLMNFAAHMAIQFVLFSQEPKLIPVMQFLGLPSNLKATMNLSPYKFGVSIFKLHSDRDILFDSLEDSLFDKDLAGFFAKYLIYLNNTPLNPKYQIFFS